MYIFIYIYIYRERGTTYRRPICKDPIYSGPYIYIYGSSIYIETLYIGTLYGGSIYIYMRTIVCQMSTTSLRGSQKYNCDPVNAQNKYCVNA